MKKAVMILCCLLGSLIARPQVDELTQLTLNIEKLAQFRQLLVDLKKAYDILYTGYNTVKGIAEGNFSLHKNFLDGLLAVSPVVQRYFKTGDIIQLQVKLIKEQQALVSTLELKAFFNAGERAYFRRVAGRLRQSSVIDLDDLLQVLTPGTMRMTDEERLARIDKIHAGLLSKLSIVRQLREESAVLEWQRRKEQDDIKVMRKLYELK